MPLKSSVQIMVVDDMAVSRGLIEQALDWIGLPNVIYEQDSTSAYRRLTARPVHLVISDYNMPGMDGLALLEGLRTTRATQRIGFILITGRADRTIIERGQKLGMNNMITKPFTQEGLKRCIETVLGPLQ